MKNFSTILIAGILLLGIVPTSQFAFADSDDDHHDGHPQQKNRVWTGDGLPSDKLGHVNDLYIDNSDPDHPVYEKIKKKGPNAWK